MSKIYTIEELRKVADRKAAGFKALCGKWPNAIVLGRHECRLLKPNEQFYFQQMTIHRADVATKVGVRYEPSTRYV